MLWAPGTVSHLQGASLLLWLTALGCTGRWWMKTITRPSLSCTSRLCQYEVCTTRQLSLFWLVAVPYTFAGCHAGHWLRWIKRHPISGLVKDRELYCCLACCYSWGRKELDTTERLNWTEYPLCCNISLSHNYILVLDYFSNYKCLKYIILAILLIPCKIQGEHV